MSHGASGRHYLARASSCLGFFVIQSFLLLATVLLMIAISYFLWKSGFLMDAEKPKPLIDRPVMDAKERKAIVKRLKRWKEEGKLTREEFEHVVQLCQAEWE